MGESVAAGTDVAVVRTSEEETYWMAPLPTPTVTMLPSAGDGPPKSWRKRTARAVLPASFWSLTRVRPCIWLGGEAEEVGVRGQPATGGGRGVAGRGAEVARDRGDGGRRAEAVPADGAAQPGGGRLLCGRGLGHAAHVEVVEAGGGLLERRGRDPGRGGDGHSRELAEAGEQGGRGGDAEEPDGRAGHGASAGWVDRWVESGVAALTQRDRSWLLVGQFCTCPDTRTRCIDRFGQLGTSLDRSKPLR